MSNDVYWIISLAVKEGQLDNLKSLMQEMVTATQSNEPNTLSYEWSLSQDGKTCNIFERYADSAAVMTHLGSFGEKFAERLLAAVDIKSFDVYGQPNDEVKGALGGLGSVFYNSIGGFTR